MIIERIRFGSSSIYRPSAISKLVRDEKNILGDEAVTLEGEKRQAKDQEQESARDQEAPQPRDAEIPGAEVSKRVEGIPLDVVA